MIVHKYKINTAQTVINHHKRSLISDIFNEDINANRGGMVKATIAEEIDFRSVENQIITTQKLSSKKVRRDAIVLIDTTLLMPQNIKKEKNKFFGSALANYANFLQNRQVDIYDSKLTGYIHYDEPIPHIHMLFMPIIKDSNNTPAFNANKLIKRNFLIEQEKFLNDTISKELGFDIDITNHNDDIKHSLTYFGDTQIAKLTDKVDKLQTEKINLKKEVKALKNEKSKLQIQVDELKNILIKRQNGDERKN